MVILERRRFPTVIVNYRYDATTRAFHSSTISRFVSLSQLKSRYSRARWQIFLYTCRRTPSFPWSRMQKKITAVNDSEGTKWDASERLKEELIAGTGWNVSSIYVTRELVVNRWDYSRAARTSGKTTAITRSESSTITVIPRSIETWGSVS